MSAATSGDAAGADEAAAAAAPAEIRPVDCERAPYTDPACATCRGTGKTGPHREDHWKMHPCRPCSIPNLGGR